MSIINQIERLKQTKEDFKRKLAERGVDVGNKLISEYPNCLDEISGGWGNSLKQLLDIVKNCYYWFYQFDWESLDWILNPNDTSSVTKVWYMFNQSKIKRIKLNTDSVFYWNRAFSQCYELVTIDISRFHAAVATQSAYLLYDCRSVRNIVIRSFGTRYILGTGAFDNCYHLTGTVDATYNPNGDNDCYFYVPRDMISTLKTDGYWAYYSNRLRPLEDYTIDGTIEWDFDESRT